MKRKFSLFLLLLLMPLAMMAQQSARSRGEAPHKNKANIEEFLQMKCDFVIQELGLNEQESKRFIPIYRELLKQKGQLFHKYGGGRSVRKALESGEQVADSTLMRVVRNNAQLQIEDAKLEQQYIEKFANVLTPLQLLSLQRAEQKFKTDMMKRAKPMRK